MKYIVNLFLLNCLLIILLHTHAQTINNRVPDISATGVSTSANTITIEFDINISLGTSGTIRLIERTQNKVQLFTELSNDISIVDNTLTITTETFGNSKSYEVQMDSGFITGFSGISSGQWTFSTGTVQPLDVVTFSPLNTSTTVVASELNTLVITFNEYVLKGSGDVLIVSDSSIDGEPSQFTISNVNISVFDKTATLYLASGDNLRDGTAYHVVIPSGLFYGWAGGQYVGTSDWSFNTKGGVSPIPSFNPNDNSVDISIGLTELTITYNENVDVGSGNIVLHSLSDGTSESYNVALPSEVVVGGKTLTMTLKSSLVGTKYYYVTMDSGVVTNKVGEPNTIIDDETTWNFITIGTNQPNIVTLSPEHNATGVIQSTALLTITFDENIKLGDSGVLRVYERSKIKEQEFDTNSPFVSVNNKIVQITIDAVGESNAYYVYADAGYFQNFANIQFTGLASTNAWTFITENPVDLLEVSVLPARNDTNISTDTSEVIITFSENVRIGPFASNPQLKNLDLGTSVDILVNNIIADGSNRQAKLPVSLGSNFDYSVIIPSDTFISWTNQYFAGIIESNWTFQTAGNPFASLTQLNPAHQDELVDPTTSNLTLTFDSTMQKGTGNIIVSFLSNGSTETIDVQDTSVVVNLFEVTIILNTIGDGMYVTVGVDDGALQNTAGIDFGGINDTDWQFLTTGASNPTIVTRNPNNNGVDILKGVTTLTITFSEVVRRGTGQIDVYERTQGVQITLDVTNETEFEIANNVVTLNVPELGESKVYYVIVPGTAFYTWANKYFAGLLSNTDWTFKTENAVNPTITNRYPDVNSTAVTNTLNITFNENILKDNTGTDIVVTSLSTDDTYTSLLSGITADGTSKHVELPLSGTLAAGQMYSVVIQSNVFQSYTDLYFQGYDSNDWIFITEGGTNPTITVLSPANDTSTKVSVATDVNVQLTFSENIVVENGNIRIYDESFDDESLIDVTTLTINKNIASFTHTFIGSRRYFIEVPATAFRSYANFYFQGINGTNAWKFITAGTTVPILSERVPADNDESVSADTTELLLRFNENIVVNSGGFKLILTCQSNGSTFEYDVNSLNLDGTNITASTGRLDESKAYYVTVDSQLIENFAGNTYGGFASITAWNFITSGTVVPTATAQSPTNGATNVPSGTTILNITTSEYLRKLTGIVQVNEKTQNNIFNVSGSNVQTIDDEIRVTVPSVGESKFYEIKLFSGSFESFAKVGLGETTYTFTTELVVEPVPTFTPAHLDTTVGALDSLTLQFAEIILLDTNVGDIEVINDSDNSTQTVLPANITISGSTATLHLTTTLIPGKKYTVTIPSGLFYSYTTQVYTGRTYGQWSFITAGGSGPTIVGAFQPNDGSTTVLQTVDQLSMLFSENVVAGSGNIYLHSESNGTIQTFDITDTNVVTFNGRNVTVLCGLLNEGIAYHVEIDNTAIENLAGLTYDGIQDENTWEFVTENAAIPSVVLYPLEDATGISNTEENITLTFSEYVRASSESVTITELTQGVNVPITSTDISSNVVTLTIGAFDNSKVYSINVPQNTYETYASKPNNAIADWRFTTTNVATPSATLNPLTNINSESVSSSVTTLTLTFLERMLGNSSAGIIQLVDESLSQSVTLSGTNVQVDGKTIRLTVALNPAKFYRVLIPNGRFYAYTGELYAGTSGDDWAFITIGTNTPSDISRTPANGELSVAIGTTVLQLEFDENIVKGTGNIVVNCISNGTSYTIDVTSADVIVDGSNVNITTRDLGTGHAYSIGIDQGALLNVGLNPWQGIGASNEWSFVIDGASAPTATLNPILYSDTISSTATSISLTFNEYVRFGAAGSVQVKDISQITGINFTYSVGNSNIDITDNIVTITWPNTEDMGIGRTYEVTMDSGFIEGFTQKKYAGLQSEDWIFTSQGANKPTATYSPVNGANNVDPSLNKINLTFSENIKSPLSGVITIVSDTDNESFLLNLADHTTLEDNLVILELNFSLTSGRLYHIELDDDVIYSFANLSFAGLSYVSPSNEGENGIATYSFSTSGGIAESAILTPTGVNISSGLTELTLEFDERMNIGTGNIQVIATKGSTYTRDSTQLLDVTNNVTISGNIATIHINDTDIDSNYTIIVPSTAFVSKVGIDFVGITGNNWIFETQGPCSFYPCFPDVVCVNDESANNGFTCVACPDGMVGDGIGENGCQGKPDDMNVPTLSVEQTKPTEMIVSYEKPRSPRATISGYVVTLAFDSYLRFASTSGDQSTSLTRTFTNLLPGTKYYATVRALTNALPSDESGVSNGTRTPRRKPDKPEKPILKSRSTSFLEISYKSLNPNNPKLYGATVVKTRLVLSTSEDPEVKVVVDEFTNNGANDIFVSVNFSSLNFNSEYYCTAQYLIDTANERYEENSDVSSLGGVFKTLTQPSKPPDPTFMSATATSITLQLAFPLELNNAPLANFVVRYYETSDPDDVLANIQQVSFPLNTVVTVTSLDVNKVYYFDVQAYVDPADGVSSEYSDTAGGFSTLKRPDQPDPLYLTRTSTTLGLTSISVRGRLPDGAGTTISGLEFRYSNNSNMEDAVIHPSTSLLLEREFTGLDEATEYYFDMRALTNAPGVWDNSLYSSTFGPATTLSNSITNQFTFDPVIPSLTGSVNRGIDLDGFSIDIMTKATGYVWAAIYSDATTVNNALVTTPVGDLCNIGATSVTALTLSTIVLSSCGLSAGTAYKIGIYTENDNTPSDDGELKVRSFTMSNTYLTEDPSFVSYTNDYTLQVQFKTSSTVGKTWGMIIEKSKSFNVIIDDIKLSNFNGATYCGWEDTGNTLENVGTFNTRSLDACSLNANTEYVVFIYVEHSQDEYVLSWIGTTTPSNKLISLQSSIALNPSFNVDQLLYSTDNLAKNITNITLLATIAPTARMTISIGGNLQTVDSGVAHVVDLQSGLNEIEIAVTVVSKTRKVVIRAFVQPDSASGLASSLQWTTTSLYSVYEDNPTQWENDFRQVVYNSLLGTSSQININQISQTINVTSGSTIINFFIYPTLTESLDAFALNDLLTSMMANSSSYLMTQSYTTALLVSQTNTVITVDYCADGQWRENCGTIGIACGSAACRNGGACSLDSSTKAVRCDCIAGYFGPACEVRGGVITSELTYERVTNPNRTTVVLSSGVIVNVGTKTNNIMLVQDTVIVSFKAYLRGSSGAKVYFGPLNSPLKFICSVVNDSLPVFSLNAPTTAFEAREEYDLECEFPVAYGYNLTLTLVLQDSRSGKGSFQEASTVAITYPSPIITKKTLRREGFNPTIDDNIDVSVITGVSVLGGTLVFGGKYFYPTSDMIIYYGPASNRKLYQCVPKVTDITATTVVCEYQPGSGSNNKFQVNLLGATSNIGDDIFNYPKAPVIDSVEGCLENIDNKTLNCPTDGLINGEPVILTITGRELQVPVQVSVGGSECGFVNGVPGFLGSKITCRLPQGAGADQIVLAIRDEILSLPVRLLSYSRPVINKLITSDCTRVDDKNIIDCPRQGMVDVQIVGTNFAPGTPSVLIGGVPCNKTTIIEEHRIVNCTLPPGNRIERGVLLSQDRGLLNINESEISGNLTDSGSGVSLSYLQCRAGEYELNSNCFDCPTGTYTSDSSQTACLNCSIGTFAGTKKSEICNKCSPGKYQDKEAQNVCKNCTIGKYTNVEGQIGCLVCLAGTYSSITGLSVCTRCDAGKISLDFATNCTSCEPGFYSPSTGGKECLSASPGTKVSVYNGVAEEPCDPGYYQPLAGEKICLQCPPGKYSSFPGSESCIDCDPQFFTEEYGSTFCEECPEAGAICEPDKLTMLDNYWRVNEGNGKVTSFPCPIDVCENGECTSGRLPALNNTLCGKCLPEYTNWGGTCADCSAGWQPLLVFLWILQSFVPVVLVHRAVQPSRLERETRYFNIETFLKIFLYYVQTGILMSGPLSTNIFDFIFYFNLDVSKATASLQICYMPLSPIETVLLAILKPFIMIGYMFLLIGIIYLYRVFYDEKDRFQFKNYLRSLLSIFLFTYSELAVSCFHYLNCVEVGDERVIFVNPAISCDSDEYKSLIPLVYFITVTFLIMAPITLLLVVLFYTSGTHDIRKNKETFDQYDRYLRLFYFSYHSNAYYWQAIVLIRRALYVIVDVLFYYNLVVKYFAFTVLSLFVLLQHYLVKAPAPHKLFRRKKPEFKSIRSRHRLRRRGSQSFGSMRSLISSFSGRSRTNSEEKFAADILDTSTTSLASDALSKRNPSFSSASSARSRKELYRESTLEYIDRVTAFDDIVNENETNKKSYQRQRSFSLTADSFSTMDNNNFSNRRKRAQSVDYSVADDPHWEQKWEENWENHMRQVKGVEKTRGPYKRPFENQLETISLTTLLILAALLTAFPPPSTNTVSQLVTFSLGIPSVILVAYATFDQFVLYKGLLVNWIKEKINNCKEEDESISDNKKDKDDVNIEFQPGMLYKTSTSNEIEMGRMSAVNLAPFDISSSLKNLDTDESRQKL